MAKINLDKIQAKGDGTVVTFRADVDLENGALITLGDLHAGEREAFQVESTGDNDEKRALLVASVEHDYAANILSYDYTTKAGEEGRAIFLEAGDMVQVEQAVVGTAAVGDVVVRKSGGYGYEVDTAGLASTALTKFKVERETKFGYDKRDMFLLLVL